MTAGEPHRVLHRLAGRWSGEETVSATRWAQAGPATSRVEADVVLGGAYVLQSYQQIRQGEVSFEARSMFGWDPERAHYAMFLFDSMGFVPQEPGTGTWDGSELVFIRRSNRGAGRHRYVFDGDAAYRMTVSFSLPDGDWLTVVEGEFHRI